MCSGNIMIVKIQMKSAWQPKFKSAICPTRGKGHNKTTRNKELCIRVFKLPILKLYILNSRFINTGIMKMGELVKKEANMTHMIVFLKYLDIPHFP